MIKITENSQFSIKFGCNTKTINWKMLQIQNVYFLLKNAKNLKTASFYKLNKHNKIKYPELKPRRKLQMYKKFLESCRIRN